jgi:cholesterol transport system auxiliary component
MTRIRLHRVLCVALLPGAFLLSGCAQSATAERKYYALEVERQGPPAKMHAEATLRLRRFNVDEAFSTRQLVYRVNEFEYEPDYYHQFLVLPGVMITEGTRDWLANSGLFDRVTAAGSRVESAYVLEGNVIALYADFRSKSAPVAVVALRFFLLAGPETNETVALARTYKAESPIAARTAEAVVEALSKSLDDILTHLEADLEKTLARQPGKSSQ